MRSLFRLGFGHQILPQEPGSGRFGPIGTAVQDAKLVARDTRTALYIQVMHNVDIGGIGGEPVLSRL